MKNLRILGLCALGVVLVSCNQNEENSSEIASLKERINALEKKLAETESPAEQENPQQSQTPPPVRSQSYEPLGLKSQDEILEYVILKDKGVIISDPVLMYSVMTNEVNLRHWPSTGNRYQEDLLCLTKGLRSNVELLSHLALGGTVKELMVVRGPTPDQISYHFMFEDLVSEERIDGDDTATATVKCRLKN